MTLSPVTLDEFKAYINDTAASDKDAEMWAMVLSATQMVETRVGALEVREVTERVNLAAPYLGYPQGELTLRSWPVYGDSFTVVAASTGAPTPADSFGFNWTGQQFYRSFAYDVTFMVGRNPVPENLRHCVLIVAEQLWQSQRGPMTPARPGITPNGPNGTPRGFAWPNRALEIIADYALPAFA